MLALKLLLHILENVLDILHSSDSCSLLGLSSVILRRVLGNGHGSVSMC